MCNPTYRVIEKKLANRCEQFSSVRKLAIWLWDKNCGDIIIIKSDKYGDRVVDFCDFEVNFNDHETLQHVLENS